MGTTYSALPKLHHSPARCQQLQLAPGVASDILIKFGLPKFGAGARGCGIAAPGMPMPEAAVNKYTKTVARQYQIWLAWQPFVMKAIPEAVTVK